MPTLISGASGDFTSASTWKLASSAAELDSEAASTAISTSLTATQSFVPGAITVDAFSLKVISRVASPTGTLSVHLYDATLAQIVAGTSFIENISDLPINGWMRFTFSSPVTLNAGNNYQIRVQASVASQINLYRDATTSNWSRQLRTTTTQAPVAGDKLIMGGEYSGGVVTPYTITMSSTAAVDYGFISSPQSVVVGRGATFNFATAASTNYRLNVVGIMQVNDGGTFTIGTPGSPIPASSSALLEFQSTASANSGLIINNGATFTTFGNALTNDRAFLAADASVGASTLTTNISTGWLLNDEIGLAPTGRVVAQNEKVTLTANASGTSLSISPTLAFAHSGTGTVAGEVINLTRNVKIKGLSTTNTAFVYFQQSSIVDCNWTEFTLLGHAVTAKRRGVDVDTTTGSCTFNRCSFHTYGTGNTVGITTSLAGTDNVSILNCVLFAAGYISIYWQNGTTGNNVLIDNTWGFGSTTHGFYSASNSISYTNCRVAGNGSGFTFIGGGLGRSNAFNNNVAHTSTSGFNMTGLNNSTSMSNLTAWRCTGTGFIFTNCTNLLVTNLVGFGSSTSNFNISGSRDCTFINGSSNAEVGFATSYGMYLADLTTNVVVSNFAFANTANHTSGDLVTTGLIGSAIFHNSTFNSPIENPVAFLYPGITYASQNHQNIAGNNKIVKGEGNIARDTTIFRNASPSVRLSPIRSDIKLRAPYSRVAVLAGNTTTIRVWVRKSTAGDGTAYNGAQPRLVVRPNPAAGINDYVVLATASAAAGVWEELVGVTPITTEDTVLTFRVDCDGTQGWVNMDDLSFGSAFTEGLDIWAHGEPFVVGTVGAGNFTEVPEEKVELGFQYKFNSINNNRTGTRRQPVIADVKTGVVYGPSDTLTGTYDGSDRWTDPGDDNVRLGTAYKANSLANNKAGRVTVPTAANVKTGVTFETDLGTTGTYDGSDRWTDPGDDNVRLGTAYKANSLANNKTGTVRVPPVSEVKLAVDYDSNDSLTGTYDGSDRWTDPGEANVRDSIAYKANSLINNKLGTIIVPSEDNVRDGTPFDSSGTSTGNLVVPVAADVRDGVTFDSNDSVTGTLDLPLEDDVVLNVQYDNLTKTGTVRIPLVSDVRFSVQYGPNDSLTGAFSDGTPPTFAGVDTVTAQGDGSILASWGAAVDPSTPLTYFIYMQPNTDVGLFSSIPFCTQATSLFLYSVPGGSSLVNGVTYYIGVRAVDGQGNMELNTVVLSATSSGVVDREALYEAHAVFSINAANELEGTFWSTLDGNIYTNLLGTASYTIYDKNGVTIGITESGITPDSKGLFRTTPVLALALQDLTHYIVKVEVVAAGQSRIAYKGITLGE